MELVATVPVTSRGHSLALVRLCRNGKYLLPHELLRLDPRRRAQVALRTVNLLQRETTVHGEQRQRPDASVSKPALDRIRLVFTVLPGRVRLARRNLLERCGRDRDGCVPRRRGRVQCLQALRRAA